jgi:aminoglycoside phosphotransferase (APT) family kinase protein
MLDYKTTNSHRAAVDRWNNYVAIGAKTDSGKNRFLYCIAGQFLREMIPHLLSGVGSFTLSHPNLHLGNICVDDDFNITSIIDWSSSSSGPVTEPLAIGPFARSAEPTAEFLVAAFRSAFSQRGSRIVPDLTHANLWEISERL